MEIDIGPAQGQDGFLPLAGQQPDPDKQGHAPRETSGPNSSAFMHDVDRNMTNGLGGKNMRYDGENRPLMSITEGGALTEYTYGADGKRLEKIESSGVNNSPEVANLQDHLSDLETLFGASTGVFDAATDAALFNFQLTFKDVMPDPWNITEPTGIKCKTTNKLLNCLAGCDTPAVFLEGVGLYQVLIF